MTSLRRPTLAVLAVAAVGLLGACTSQPSAKAVAKDVVQSLSSIAPAEQQCMLDVIDGMDENDLEALGKDRANLGDAITNAESGSEDMQAFVARLADCRDQG